jgi:hypothetical protein
MSLRTLLIMSALALPLSAQVNAVPHTDPEKIADAQKGGPAYISQMAAVLDWPTTTSGSYRELRKGTNGWTCLPTSPQHQPVCADRTFLTFFQDAVAHRPVHVDQVGLAYMYEGDTVSPHGGSPSQPYHVGPHIMLVVPDGAGLDRYTTDGSTGEAYINRVPGTTTPYLVIPIHEHPHQGDLGSHVSR